VSAAEIPNYPPLARSGRFQATQTVKVLLADEVVVRSIGTSSRWVTAGLITNSDTGVLVTWNGGVTDTESIYAMAVTNGSSVASVNFGATIPGQVGGVTPVLQAEDGSFVGTAWREISPELPYEKVMVAFEASGASRWIVPEEEPMIALEEGSVITKLGTIYDANGSGTGQVNMVTWSWTGNAYRIGSIEQIVTNAIRTAKSWWPFGSGSASGNNTAVQQPWFSPLKSCPGAVTPCPQEAITSALGALKTLIQSPCTACDTWVFNKTPGTSKASFLSFLSRPPRFWDGTRSFAPANVAFCPAGFWSQLSCGFGLGETVRDYVQRTASDAVSQTPADSGKGMQVFFNPTTGICSVSSVQNPASGDQGVLNQATLLHEALHGYTGKFDLYLETAFGVAAPSANITYYLEDHVIFALGARACGN
jgi:hypothetical protein